MHCLLLTVLCIIHVLQVHWKAEGASAGWLAFSFVSSMPEEPPKSFKEVWAWTREALQSAIPVHRRSTETLTQKESK